MVDLGKFFGWSNTMKRGTTVLVSMGRLLGNSGLFMALLCAVSQVSAQVAYPTKPIHFLIGSGPGGLADVTTRLIGEKLSERLGRQVVVENRPSAGGIIATRAVASAPPDGHTVMVMVSGNAISKSLLKSLPYDLDKDFAPTLRIAAASCLEKRCSQLWKREGKIEH